MVIKNIGSYIDLIPGCVKISRFDKPVNLLTLNITSYSETRLIFTPLCTSSSLVVQMLADFYRPYGFSLSAKRIRSCINEFISERKDEIKDLKNTVHAKEKAVNETEKRICSYGSLTSHYSYCTVIPNHDLLYFYENRYLLNTERLRLTFP